MKRISISKILMMLLSVVLLATSVAAAPAPQIPEVTFTLIGEGLPATMQVGESATVTVQVTSSIPFVFSAALPTAFFPGRYVVAAQGDHSRAGTTATLSVTFTAKDSTSELSDPAVPVAVVAGAHFKGGFVATQRFPFLVAVP